MSDIKLCYLSVLELFALGQVGFLPVLVVSQTELTRAAHTPAVQVTCQTR